MNVLNLFINFIKEIMFDYVYFLLLITLSNLIYLAVLKRTILLFVVVVLLLIHLTSETVQSTTLTFQCIYNIHCCNCLSLGVFSIGDGITDDIF
jgi:hypothetical protein